MTIKNLWKIPSGFWQRNSKKIIPIAVLILLVLIGHFIFAKPKTYGNPVAVKLNKISEKPAKEVPALPEAQPNSDEILKTQIGQMLILGFRGTQFQKDSFIGKAIKNLKIGGVILFDFDMPSRIPTRNVANPEQVKKLIASLQASSQTPLFIAADLKTKLEDSPRSLGINFDLIQMASSSKNIMICGDPTTKEKVVEMVQAGCDLIIISNNVSLYDETLPYKIEETIFRAVKAGEISPSSIEMSYNKIVKLKRDFAIIE